MANVFSTCFFLLLYVILRIHNVSENPLVISPKNNVTYRGSRTGNIEHFQNINPPMIPPDLDGLRLRYHMWLHQALRLTSMSANSRCNASILQRNEGNERRLLESTHESKLPVVVWQHGGGVVKGSAYDSHFETDRMIGPSQEIKSPVIYVALHYRLTTFGFAWTPLLKNEMSLNVSVRDQRLGFLWIKDNFADFGGDPL
jgi:hypothetical protein